MKSKFVFFIVFSFLFLAVSINAQTLAANQTPSVQVTGTAEIQVVPDVVLISLRVSKADKNLQVAKTQNDENVAKIIALTRRFQIDAKDVKTDFISVKEKFDRVKQKDDDEYTSVFAGYTVSKTIVVRLKDLAKFEEFFSEVVKIGVTEIGSVSFESSELRRHKDRARAMAMRAAREKADALAKEIGQTVGKALSIEEKDIDGYRSPTANYSSNSFSVSDDESDAETFAVGTITVRAQVEVAFLLN
ncbi:MAG TPA: SIMPL domain-containing protein [Pyrinomonadaceae bacterium]|nr:SIMPL domain-containing protein [Pyrinomonadaceae bacterium]